MSNRSRGFRPFAAWLLVLILGVASVDAQARTAVSATRLGIHPDGVTRFVMDVSDHFDFTVTAHTDPMHLAINTSGVAWMTDAALTKPVGSVRGLRYEENRQGGRIILVLDEPALVKSAFVLSPREGMGWRFVMDVKQVTRAAFAAEAQKTLAKPVAKPVVKSDPGPVPQAAAPAISEPAAAPAPRQAIILRSPALTPEATPEPKASAPAQAAETRTLRPAPAVKQSPAIAAKDGAVMSAAMPPPAQRPVEKPTVEEPQAEEPKALTIAALVASSTVPAPQPAQPEVTKVAAPLPVPPPEPKPAKGDGRPVVVIDPGHGGVDPGAIGVSGIYEKNITLATARELKKLLESTGRYKVHLTRDRDVFIRLRDRVAIARQHDADLFISLHADAVKSPKIRGLSVYTLSQNSSDAEAQALADKENKADLIAGIDLSHESLDVANILIDLAQRETMNRSAVFAGALVTHVGRDAPLLGNTHRFAGFAVLKAPDVPSVLIELGYLSHPVEERELRKPAYRSKLAKAIVRSVDGYFLEGQKAKYP